MVVHLQIRIVNNGSLLIFQEYLYDSIKTLLIWAASPWAKIWSWILTLQSPNQTNFAYKSIVQFWKIDCIKTSLYVLKLSKTVCNFRFWLQVEYRQFISCFPLRNYDSDFFFFYFARSIISKLLMPSPFADLPPNLPIFICFFFFQSIDPNCSYSSKASSWSWSISL
jgi:hypothetical protein